MDQNIGYRPGRIPGEKFRMGDIHVGKRAQAALQENNPKSDMPMDFLFTQFIYPHCRGEWDALDAFNRWLNEVGIGNTKFPIRSVYKLEDERTIWVITLNREAAIPDTFVCSPVEFGDMVKPFILG